MKSLLNEESFDEAEQRRTRPQRKRRAVPPPAPVVAQSAEPSAPDSATTALRVLCEAGVRGAYIMLALITVVTALSFSSSFDAQDTAIQQSACAASYACVFIGWYIFTRCVEKVLRWPS
jgi:hypothetical protein